MVCTAAGDLMFHVTHPFKKYIPLPKPRTSGVALTTVQPIGVFNSSSHVDFVMFATSDLSCECLLLCIVSVSALLCC